MQNKSALQDEKIINQSTYIGKHVYTAAQPSWNKTLKSSNNFPLCANKGGYCLLYKTEQNG